METSENSAPAAQSTPAQTPAPKSFDWDTLKPWVVGGAIVVVLALLIAGLVVVLGEMTENRIRKEFTQLTDEASRTNFAKRYAAHPLGGLVLLGQANKYFAQGNYAAAQTAFNQAANGGLLANPVLDEQAKLGEAFSQYYLDPAKGLSELEKLAQDATLLDSTRAYAAYELMSKAIYDKDLTLAGQYAALIRTLPNAATWQQQLVTLSQIYPELSAQ